MYSVLISNAKKIAFKLKDQFTCLPKFWELLEKLFVIKNSKTKPIFTYVSQVSYQLAHFFEVVKQIISMNAESRVEIKVTIEDV